jgi:Glycosyl transferase family 90
MFCSPRRGTLLASLLLKTAICCAVVSSVTRYHLSASGIVPLSWKGLTSPPESQSERPENAQPEAPRTTCVDEVTCELASKVLHDAHTNWQKPYLIDEIVCALIHGDERVKLIAVNPKDPRNITNHPYALAAGQFFKDTAYILPKGFCGPVTFLAGDSDDFMDDKTFDDLWELKVPFVAHSMSTVNRKRTRKFIWMPDFHYIESKAFEKITNTTQFVTPFETRKNAVFWRGTTTGYSPGCHSKLPEACVTANHPCFEVPRVRLVDKAQSIDYLDIRLIRPSQCCSECKYLLEEKGMAADHAPESVWIKHKGIIDIDGNVNAWGRYWRLRSGSVVFLVESEFDNFYSERLVPWRHYVPVKRNLDDIVERTKMVNSSDLKDVALLSLISSTAANLMESITYESQVIRFAKDLSTAVRLTNLSGSERANLESSMQLSSDIERSL